MNKLDEVINCLEEVKLLDIENYDLRGESHLFDYFIIATASNKRQLSAALDKIYEKKIDFDHIEGKGEGGWILIDMKDIVVNIMTKESREMYSLDKYFTELKFRQEQ